MTAEIPLTRHFAADFDQWIRGLEPYEGKRRRRFAQAPAPADPVALVSANFGGIDSPKPIPAHPKVRPLYYTDRAIDLTLGWTVIHPKYPRHDFSPRLRGRYFKHQIHRLDEVRDCRWLVWADSNLLVKDPSFLNLWTQALEQRKARDRIMLVPHPARRTVEDEFRYITEGIRRGSEYLRLRYEKENMAGQVEWMQAQGWDLQSRVVNGTIWMVENNRTIAHALDAWWDQNLRFGLMDQLSLTPLLKRLGCEPALFNVNVWGNEFWEAYPHRG